VKDRKPTTNWTKHLGCLVVLIGILFEAPLAGLGQTPADPANMAPNSGQRFVSIDFNNVDISVFVKFMSELTGKNFVIDQRVRGKVTIISPSKISVDEAYQVFESVLEVHGFSTVKAGGVVKIIPTTDARTKSIETRIREESGKINDQVVTQLIPLKYANPDEIKRLLTPLIGKSSVILSYPDTNTLIITDTKSNIKRLMRILKVVDVAGTGQNITVIPVEYADASKLVTILGTVFKTDPRSRSRSRMADPISFVADERTNTIILLSSEADSIRVKDLVVMLDKETPRGKGNINVYYLENATAEDVAAVLQDIPKQGDKSSAQTAGKKTAPVVSDKVRITADKATNSLIIMADKEDYEVLEDIIKKIDIPRAMVYIEALIMEVKVGKDLELGTEWQVGDRTNFNEDEAGVGGGWQNGNVFERYKGAIVPQLPTSGFSLGMFGEMIKVGNMEFQSVAAMAKAFQSDSNYNILSTPQVLTTDNEEAKISIVTNLAFQTTATQSSTGSDVYNSYEYRDVGKLLTITPHISKDRMVRLKIELEVSSLQESNNNRPVTSKRTVNTTVIVKDSNTIVIGGLIDDENNTTNSQVPCLGSIPMVGWLFKNQNNKKTKTNLYVFLTPKVVKSPDEANKVYHEKKNHIQGLREGKIKMYNSKDSSEPVIISDPVLNDNGTEPEEQDPLKEEGYE
jgi:general secretion pathway protein D